MDERSAKLTAGTRDVAAYWQVHPETARKILRAHQVRPARAGRTPRWWIADVLGVGSGPSGEEARAGPLSAALLTPADCSRRDPLGRSRRSWRRIMATGRIPTVHLAPGIGRVRPGDLAALAELV